MRRREREERPRGDAGGRGEPQRGFRVPLRLTPGCWHRPSMSDKPRLQPGSSRDAASLCNRLLRLPGGASNPGSCHFNGSAEADLPGGAAPVREGQKVLPARPAP